MTTSWPLRNSLRNSRLFHAFPMIVSDPTVINCTDKPRISSRQQAFHACLILCHLKSLHVEFYTSKKIKQKHKRVVASSWETQGASVCRARNTQSRVGHAKGAGRRARQPVWVRATAGFNCHFSELHTCLGCVTASSLSLPAHPLKHPLAARGESTPCLP